MGTGLDLLGALDKVDQELGMSEAAVVDAAGEPVPTDADNARAMAELNAQMAKVGGLFR